MPGKFAVTGQAACAASAPQTLLTVMSAATVRPLIFFFTVGSSGTPADNAILWIIQRCTAAGSGGTAVTPQALDPSWATLALATSMKAHTTDPTYTSAALLFREAVNQRATSKFFANPGCELVLPATAANGVGLYPTHASFTGNVDGTIHFAE